MSNENKYTTKGGLVSIRRRQQFTVEEIQEMSDLAGIKTTIDAPAATAWFNGLNSSEKKEFLHSIGVKTMTITVVPVKTIPVDSSFVTAFGYNKDNSRLQIEMNGNQYQYLHVPYDRHQDLLLAAAQSGASVGKKYNEIIKGKFESIKL